MTHPSLRWMHHLTALLLLTAALTVASAADEDDSLNSTDTEQQMIAAVTRRIDGYNAHDLDAFLEAHAHDVDIIEYPDKRIGVGRAHLAFVFADQFDRNEGHINVLHQIVIGNRVISHEHITTASRIEELVIVYTVEQGLITSFRLIE
ncbi:MAG: nuclear transport factor 2 family protein [Pseudomonadota bacterium]